MNLLQKAQKVFNAFIRNRDKDKGCISCGGRIDHAGHYFNQGQFSALRFNEINVNGQCQSCNTFKHGNLISYRKGLIKRYGEEKILELENSAELRKVKKWSKFELEQIIKLYEKTLKN